MFIDWDSWLKQAKRATTIAIGETRIIIEVVSENLHSANLVKEGIPGFLSNVKQLEKQWK